jgi:hypothetical protein
MSADNWAHCLRCSKAAEAELVRHEEEVIASYGTIPMEQFDRARADLVTRRKEFEQREETFREDYEIFGAEDGLVQVHYSGQCTSCGLALKFVDHHPIPGINQEEQE